MGSFLLSGREFDPHSRYSAHLNIDSVPGYDKSNTVEVRSNGMCNVFFVQYHRMIVDKMTSVFFELYGF